MHTHAQTILSLGINEVKYNTNMDNKHSIFVSLCEIVFKYMRNIKQPPRKNLIYKFILSIYLLYNENI